MNKEWPRLALTLVIVSLFAFATLNHYSAAIEQTIVAITMLAVGYWLGSSKGSTDKTDALVTRPTGEPSDPLHTEEE